MTIRILAFAALGLALAAAAPLIQGDPIPNRDVVIDGDPSGLTQSGTTDRSGVVMLSAEPGRYALMLPNVQTLRVPAVARVEVGRTVLTTNTIQPGGRGNAYFTGRDGRRLIIPVGRGQRVRIVLTEAAPVAGGSAGGSTRNMPVYNPDGTIVHPEYRADWPIRLPEPPVEAGTGSTPEGRAGVAVGVAVGDVNGDGRADARTDPRIPPPAQPGSIGVDGLGEAETNSVGPADPTGRVGRRVDPRIPPPAVAAPRTVTVIGTLSLER